MNLEDTLRSALQQKSTDLSASPELKERIMNQVTVKQGGKRMKKWLLSCIIVAALLIPTGAFAAYNYLADFMYGSQQNVAQIGGTIEAYEKLESKLQESKQLLSTEEFTVFMSLLKQLGEFNLKIADSEGTLHPDQLSVDEQQQYTKLITSLEPLFNKLSEQASSKTNRNPNSVYLDLDKAEKVLSEEELSLFVNLLDESKEISVKAVDAKGKFHQDRLSDQDKSRLEQIQEQLQSYLDKLE
ncbi:DUF3600 domain-containing protein [Paenibacillus sp. FSL K6-2524]|uniref:DUF3600 domain-containing protein n=1 Tax=Paenibacillus sp. FSL K6-2524 TaxID=2954516 RepID=UPI0030F687FA